MESTKHIQIGHRRKEEIILNKKILSAWTSLILVSILGLISRADTRIASEIRRCPARKAPKTLTVKPLSIILYELDGR
jgi:hypothetical protein